MREWLVIWITNWLYRARAEARASNAAVEAEISGEKVELPPCPICGEVWDEKEIFCYYCGYQLSDENIPLYPPPKRNSGLTDPDCVLPEPDAVRLRGKFDSISKSKGIDVAILLLSHELRDKLRFDEKRWDGATIDGVAYALYNTWKIGAGSGLKGILIVIDTNGPDCVLVTGKNGPRISGQEFRSWFSNFKPSANLSDENFLVLLSEELEHIAGKIEGMT
ncbi:MAG: hypothetical protein NTY09_04655 [bacterium]|nr:hypothetical protein [bacterium]